MAKLSAADRNSLPKNSFVFPEARRYPIPDESHARDALARSSGKSAESAVRAAVSKKFPGIKISGRTAVLAKRYNKKK